MITGIRLVPRVIDECYCKSSEDSYFAEIGDYKTHSVNLMPKIPFEEANEFSEEIDSTIFVNDQKNKLNFKSTTKSQNYLTTHFVGRAPLKFYGPKTKMGEQFILICKDGNPSYNTRYFGTRDAVYGFNRNANDSFIFPKGD